ncbi:MAG: hypothetical protein ACREIC_15085, partial [Limisphaerales bacterium]
MSGEGESSPPANAGEAGTFREFLHSWRYFLWLLGLIVLVALVLGEENWRGDRAWNRYKKEMAARGDPVELAE